MYYSFQERRKRARSTQTPHKILITLVVLSSEGTDAIQSVVQQSNHTKEGECQWRLDAARHGSKVTVSVTCYNAVQLYTRKTSLPQTVLLLPPDLSQVYATKSLYVRYPYIEFII